MRLRAAEPTDVPALLDITREGFDTYRDFAPPGWEPPYFKVEEVVAIEDVAMWTLAEEDEEGGEPVGHVMAIPARRAKVPVDDPRLAHLMMLFVRRTHWGSGVATTLHEAIVGEVVRRGFAEVRLFTPAQQGRARRFYEREGYRLVDEWADSPFGFPIVEYRLTCPTPS